MIILAGDIGGTNSRLTFFEQRGEELFELTTLSFMNHNYASFEALLADALAQSALQPASSCLGVAGPVVDQRVRFTNLPWAIDAREAAEVLKRTPVYLLNDLEATAHGVLALPPAEMTVLHGGEAQMGNRCVISAGTGLGEAGLVWTGERYIPVACEGGHGSFSPVTDLQMDLLKFLNRRFAHVSFERIVSGQGLVHLFEFACSQTCENPSEVLGGSVVETQAPSLITAAALSEKSRAAMLAVDLFIECFAIEAGNLALKYMACGGVYLAGGISPKLKEKLSSAQFYHQFLHKGRMGELLAKFPLYLVTNERVAVMGAARFAAKHL